MKNVLVTTGRVLYLTCYAVGLFVAVTGRPVEGVAILASATPLAVAIEKWSQQPPGAPEGAKRN